MDANAMASMNISLPESMREWVMGVAQGEGFATASEYVRSLIREDQRRRAKEELDEKLLKALNEGGASIEYSPELFGQMKERLRAPKPDRA